MDNHLENKKTNINILMISGTVLLLIIFLFRPVCIFKNIFNIPCPTCGLTRGFIEILHFDFIESLKYNILSIPIFISIIIFYLLYSVYILLKKEYIIIFVDLYIKNFKLIILLFIISWIVNIVKFLYYF